jgi:hypothetical protein
MALFPRQTVHLTSDDSLPRRFIHSLAGTAIISGVLMQVYHGLIVRAGATQSYAVFLIGLLGQTAIVLTFATMHLSSHPVHQWWWRAPMFGVIESFTAMVMSAVLIALHSEIYGTDYAHWDDWLTLSKNIFFWHMLGILIFALVLGVTVQFVRYAMLRHEHRDSTARKIHADHVKQEQEAS